MPRCRPKRWGEAMAALVDEVRARPAGATAWRRRSARIGAIVWPRTFPKTDADVNELPDRLIEL